MPSLRVSSGTLHGRRVPVPRNARPTSERARQAFFNIVSDRVRGTRFLDLFAGTGIFSLEAVSRGAREATAVELDRRSAEAIKQTAQEWSAPVHVVAGDVFQVVPRMKEPYDVVYADPPYDFGRYDDLLALLDEQLALADGAMVAIEHRRRTEPFTRAAHRLRAGRRAEYGEIWITFFIT